MTVKIPFGPKITEIEPEFDLEKVRPENRLDALAHALQHGREYVSRASFANDPMAAKAIQAQLLLLARQMRSLGLPKSAQLDAYELLRRSERVLGAVTVAAQLDGRVGTIYHNRGGAREDYVRSNGKVTTVVPRAIKPIMSPREFYANAQEQSDCRTLADCSDAEFEAVITDARAAGNLSRNHIVRKIKALRGQEVPNRQAVHGRQRGPTEKGLKRLQTIKRLAERGMTSEQIGAEVGNTRDHIKKLAADAGIIIPADQAMRHMLGQRLDHDQLAGNTISSLEGLASGLDLFDPNGVTNFDDVDHWVTSLNKVIRSLYKFQHQLQKVAHNNQQDQNLQEAMHA